MEKVQRAVPLFTRRFPFALCVLTAIFSFCIPVHAQEVTAAITGKVTDPSGAVLSGAQVTATDTQRGTVWNTQTNQDGAYNLPRLPIGTYDVKVQAPGFQTTVQSKIQLELNQTARVDLQMNLGSVSETVEVDAAPPLLQTETTQLSTVLNSHTNETLPLATRNYVQLTLLAPGSVHPDPSTFKNGQATGNGGRPYINGNREQSNNFLLDGADNNQVSDNLVGYTPSVDAIAEFNMITQNASAEFGNFQGGIVSASIKSGTNAYHGDAFEFFRNDVLNANEWSNNWNGLPKTKVRWNEFGGVIGGPIKRDKLFFFADYQGERFDNPASTGTVSVFTAAERAGDFSALLDTNQTGGSKPIQLYNPFSLDAKGNRVPFANNQIPLSLLDPVASKLFASKYYPLPINGQLRNNQINASHSATNGDQGDAKVDWNISDKDRMFGRYSQSRQSQPGTNSFPLFFGSFFEAPTHSGVLDWTRTVSPSVVNEARVAVNYTILHNGGVDNGLGNVAQELGIANGNDRGPGLLSLGFGGIANGIGSSNIGTQQLFANTVIQYEDAVIWTKGTHTMHLGFQGWRQRIDTFYAGNNGLTGFINFDGRFTAGPSPTAVASSTTGLGDADFFLGLPSNLGRGVNTGTWGQRANILSGYFQDNWHLSNTLTLNLGVRYETHTPWVEVKNRQTNFGLFTGSVETAGQSKLYSNSRALYNNYNGALNFQPRIGIAWTPAPKTVVRAAFTISSYLEGTGTNLRLPLNPPLNEEFEARYNTGTYALPPSRTEQGLTVLQSPSDPFSGANIRLWNPNVRPAISEQWNFSVQNQLNNSTTVQAGYVGQKGTHLMVPMPYFQRHLNADGTTSPSPYLSGNPALASISQISGTESNGNMSYNALQVTLQKRLSSGLQAQVAYTYSKCLTDSSGYYGSWGGQATPTSPYWQNLYDKKAEWGPCYYDVTHTLSSYATYELPFGRNRRFGKNLNKVVNAVAGDWQVSGILALHGGFPLTVSGPDNSNTNSRGSRADCIAPAHIFGTRNSPVGGYQWFDPNSYAAPANGTFGSCGVGTIRGPGLHSFDMSLQKEFPFTERQRLEFRGEFINLTNTPILNSPNAGLGSSQGLLQSSQGARNIQLGLKYYF